MITRRATQVARRFYFPLSCQGGYLCPHLWRKKACCCAAPYMNKTEIAETLRKEVGELEATINKLQARCERLKNFVLDLEAEIAGPVVNKQPGILEDRRFRKAIDSVFGEKPKRPKP